MKTGKKSTLVIRTQQNYTGHNGETATNVSETIPPTGLTLKQLVERNDKLVDYSEGHNDPSELPDITKMDKVERQLYIRDVATKFREATKTYKKEVAEAQKELQKQADQEKADFLEKQKKFDDSVVEDKKDDV